MSMNVGNESGDGEVMVDINTTPLIDVMLVLLVMLIMTLPIQTHAVKLDMPKPNPEQTPPPDKQPVDILVDFDGTVYWNNAPVSMATLDSYFYQDGLNETELQQEYHIRADRLAKYDTVAKVLANAQRRGVVKIGIVGTEEYVQ
ncbi:MAG: biopolymer transporter ExbD [Alphaproteobacteria bacterium]|nr:biopolymer transporter ExbD [Alphaproteobacteria bacterium]